MGIQINGQTDTVTATDGSINVGGDVTIPGVLTYEDVTNVDSVGIITAQSGLRVLSGGANITGIVTASAGFQFGSTPSYFYGTGTDSVFLRVGDGPYAEFIDAGSNVLELGNASGALALTSSGTEKVRITSSGSVGIGTDNPGARLDVEGNQSDTDTVSGNTVFDIAHFNVSGATNQSVRFYHDDTNNISYLHRVDNGGDLGFSLRSGGTNTERLRITSNGNVGLSVTNPDLKLHVNGVNALPSSSGSTPTGHLTLRAKSSSSSHGMFMGVSNAAPWSSWIQAQDANNNATNYPLLLNPNGGNVGIGTDNPKAQTWRNGTALDVYGGSGSVVGNLHIGANRGDGNQTVGSIVFYDNTQDTNHKVISIIESDKTGSTSNQRGGTVRVYVKEDATVSNSAVESATFTKDGISFPSGKGIDFSATSDASGKTSELLDDYEEGTWTPTLTGFTNAGTITGRVRNYTRIGNVVTIWFDIFQNNNNMSFSNGATITGLPFSTTIPGGSDDFHTPVVVQYYRYPASTMVNVSAYVETTDTIVFRPASANSDIRHLWGHVTYLTS